MEAIVKKKVTTEILIDLVAQYLVQNKLFRVGVLNEIHVPLKINGLECELFKFDPVMEFIRTSCFNIAGKYEVYYKNLDAFAPTANTSKTILNTLLTIKDLHLKTPVKTFAFKSDPSLTFCRIPFDPLDEIVDSPVWDSFLSNFTNNLAVRIWIGSLFFPASDRSQYLWLYGQGGNGKSTLARIISKVLGPFVRFEQAPARDDKYWTSGLLGKRLIVLDDCNNYGFVKTGLFKSLTGSSKVRIEQKYGHPSDADLDCKFLFTSNEQPMVSNEIADQRRLIFSTALNKEIFSFDASFQKNLEDELPIFISNCMILYQEHCGDGRPIPSDQTEALELGGCFDEEIESWIEKNFEYNKGCYVKVSDLNHSLSFTKLNNRRVHKFLETQGIIKGVTRIGDKTVKTFKGLKQKIFQVEFR